ncbi:uncharacterized protein B0T15DRAFT_60626 [Chaetomium strumarium]|uniref:Uncharacterized protein n=1 Tax=Chaetomium strumarium TaxID=1170767 RepID=A0AAJ0M6W0_9PEZI|nr:hypothetical protein B0T15DRAFT_60626 [Chaetomium strumarium]
MSANPDSVVNQGQFHSSVPPAQPLTTSGHQLGQQVGNEAVPEFRAKTFPPGTAPKESTYKPNPIHETPGQAMNPDVDESGRTGALDMPGATSGEVHSQSTFARPMEGQTGKELNDSKMHAGKRKKERSGLEGVGATATTSDETVEGRARALGADLPEGVERGIRGKGPGAEETNPASAAEVAAEKSRK